MYENCTELVYFLDLLWDDSDNLSSFYILPGLKQDLENYLLIPGIAEALVNQEQSNHKWIFEQENIQILDFLFRSTYIFLFSSDLNLNLCWDGATRKPAP